MESGDRISSNTSRQARRGSVLVLACASLVGCSSGGAGDAAGDKVATWVENTYAIDVVECHLAGDDPGAEWLQPVASSYGRYRCTLASPRSEQYAPSTTWCVTQAWPDEDNFSNAELAFPAEVTNSSDPSERSC